MLELLLKIEERMSHPMRLSGLFVCFIVAALLWSLPSHANNVFEVKGVYVDVTAANVTAARKQAMREGEGRALEILLKRLTLKQDHGLLPWVEPRNRAQYIRSFSVSGEKTSAVRYLATLNYIFKADEIRGLLRARSIAFAETISKPVLVLPLLDDSGLLSLWDEPNPWREAWSTLPTSNGLVPLALPLGDFADIAGMNPEQAANADEVAVTAMAQRYGVNTVVIARLVVATRNPDGSANDVDLVITRLGDKNAGRFTSLGITRLEGEDVAAYFQRIASLVHESLEESWKQDNLLQFGMSDVLPVNLPISGLQEWLAVQQRLGDVAVVRKVEMALMSREVIQLNLHFLGNLDQLISSLRQVDLDLTLSGESWTLINNGGRS